MILSNVIKEKENKENELQERLDQAHQTITKQEENQMNLRLKEEDMKVRTSCSIIHDSDLLKSEYMFEQAFYSLTRAKFHGNSRFHGYF